MAGVHDVAAALITEQQARGNKIDKMQLQKLLYMVQGAHLRRAGVPAFRGEFRAYRNGPVIEQVEASYRGVVNDLDPIAQPMGGDPTRVDDETRDTIRRVLDIYGTWTGPHLERQTKRKGSPWNAARAGVPVGEASRKVIPLRDIARWFLTRPLDPSGKPDMPDLEVVDEAVVRREMEASADIAAGRVRRADSVEDLLAQLG